MKFIRPIILAAVATSQFACSGIISGITGQPVASTPVLRAGATVPVNLATADLLQAEVGDPKAVYGLYDVGAVAGVVGEVSRSSSK